MPLADPVKLPVVLPKESAAIPHQALLETFPNQTVPTSEYRRRFPDLADAAAMAAYNRVRSLFKEGHIADCLIESRALIEKQPTFWPGYLFLASAYLAWNRDENASAAREVLGAALTGIDAQQKGQIAPADLCATVRPVEESDLREMLGSCLLNLAESHVVSRSFEQAVVVLDDALVRAQPEPTRRTRLLWEKARALALSGQTKTALAALALAKSTNGAEWARIRPLMVGETPALGPLAEEVENR